MNIQDRILDYLAQHPEGVDDDALAAALGLRQRQQANQRCRRLEQYGKVIRRRTNDKIRNFLNTAAPVVIQQEQNSSSICEERPWYWEGNVQAMVVHQLESIGFRIDSVADTASRQQGKDIIALSPFGQTLWVSAKGYPTGTIKTSPQTQARHWFAHALFDLVLWHGESASVALALALPEQKTYRNLAMRVTWFLAGINASVFWVSENGNVDQQRYGAGAASVAAGRA